MPQLRLKGWLGFASLGWLSAFRAKVDGFVPQTVDVNLRKIRKPPLCTLRTDHKAAAQASPEPQQCQSLIWGCRLGMTFFFFVYQYTW